MTIHIVAITKFQTKGLRIKASYSDETVVLRQHWENVISGLSLTERGDRVEETLPCGQAHLFAKKDESKVYIVITSIEYPLWLVRSCIDELSWTDGSTTSTMISRVMAAFSALCMSREAKYRKRLQHCIDIFAKYSNDEPGCMLYDIRINCDDVDLVNDVKRYLQFRKEEEQHKKLKEVHDKVDEIKNQMMVLPVYIRHTVAQSKHLQVKSKVLLKQVMVFRKSDAELRRKTESNYHHRLGLAKVATMVVFASVGSAIALATGCKGMDVVTVAIMGGALGYVSAQWLCWLARSIVRSLTTQVQ